MPVDPMIASGGTPVQLANPLDLAAKALSIKNLALQGRMGEQQYQTLMQNEQDKEATRQALMASGGNLSRAEGLLLQRGLQGPALAIRKSRLEEEGRQAQVNASNATTELKKNQFWRDQLVGMPDDAQSYAAWRTAALKDDPRWEQGLPPPERYVPGQTKAQVLMTADKAMDQQRMQQQQAAETARSRATSQAADVRNIRTTQTALEIARMRAKAAALSATDRPAYVAGFRDLQKEDQNLGALAPLETGLRRFRELNADVTTGRAAGYVPAILQPKRQEMEQIQNSLSMNNFRPGQGQMSNFERKLITGAGPSVHNDREANDRIVDIALGGLQTMREKAEFKQWYLDTNKKLLGADKAWNAYVEKNPRFLPGKKSGDVVPNVNRQSWTDFFKAGASPAQAAPPGAGDDLFDMADRILQGAR